MLLTAMCAAGTASCGTHTVGSYDTVMEIDGEAVVKEEYQRIVESYASEVKMQYTTEEANRKDFWTADFSGERPLEQIMELAERELVQKKTLANIAKEEKILDVPDYKSMEEQMQRHEEESIYGLTEYNMDVYYEYKFTEIESDVTEYLKQKQPADDAELRQQYEEHQTDYTSEVRVGLLVAELSGGSDELLRELSREMEQATDAKTLEEHFPDAAIYTISLSSLDPKEGKTGVYSGRWQAASRMKEGEVSEPLDAGGVALVMRCLSREENVTEPFEDVKAVLKDQIETERAKEIIRQREEKAQAVSAVDLEKVALEILEN